MFAALTDLSKLTDAEDPSYVTIQANGNEPHDPSSVINTIAPECQKRELRLEEPSDSAKDKDVSRGVLPGNPIADLRSAIANIEKELGLEDEPKKGVKTSKKRVNRAPSTRSKKKVPAKIRAQIKQATELVNKMVDRGLCAPDPDAVHEQLQQLLRFDPNALASLERVVDRHVPQVPADFGAKGGRMSRTTEKKEPKFNGNFRRYNKLKDE